MSSRSSIWHGNYRGVSKEAIHFVVMAVPAAAPFKTRRFQNFLRQGFNG